MIALALLSIVIPSKTEMFLRHTIEDVLAKATGEIEVFPVLDGYDLPDEEKTADARVHYLRLPAAKHTQKRHAINMVVNDYANGKYVMSLDAHCMMAKGFDEQLQRDHKDDWVQIPRRNRLDAENWCLQKQPDGRPPIDYEYTMWPLKFDPPGLHGFRWDERTRERWHIPLDDTMHFQGSCWFMTRDWFRELGLMQIEGYEGWGQEAEEIALKTFRAGGRTITNKNTWYAHLHKGKKYGRMYFLNARSVRRSAAYSFNYWVRENREVYQAYVERFMPAPGWPSDWREQLWT